jgi:hypothetical protein
VLLTTTAERVGRTSGFIQRQSKMTAGVFVQTVVFGWLANPHASREELSQAAALAGVVISAQGIDERLNEAAAVFLRAMVEETSGK